jgi:hypothetical protein
MNIYWNKYYGYDKRYPDEPNYRVISGILFNRDFTLIIIWSKLQLHLSISENLQTQWNELEGPAKTAFNYIFYGF